MTGGQWHFGAEGLERRTQAAPGANVSRREKLRLEGIPKAPLARDARLGARPAQAAAGPQVRGSLRKIDDHQGDLCNQAPNEAKLPFERMPDDS